MRAGSFPAELQKQKTNTRKGSVRLLSVDPPPSDSALCARTLCSSQIFVALYTRQKPPPSAGLGSVFTRGDSMLELFWPPLSHVSRTCRVFFASRSGH